MGNTETTLDYSKIDNLQFEGIDTKDYPDFCDAYISNASYAGEPMTDEMLEEINQDGDYVYEMLMKRLH